MDLIPALAPVRNATDVAVTSEEWSLLGLVDGKSSADELARREGIDLGRVTRLLQSLESKGLVTLSRPPEEEGAHTPPPPPPPPPRRAHRARGGPVTAPEPVEARRSEERFHIALVCTGNRFRSPIMEGLLRDLTRDLPVDVTSVGTQNLGAAPALPEAIRLARRFGLDISSHRARPLSRVRLEDADLVIGFEREHVALAVSEARARHDRTFLATELLELMRRAQPPAIPDPLGRARFLVGEAHRLRPDPLRAWPVRPLPDPLNGPPDGYARVAESLRKLSERLVHALFGGVKAGSRP